MGRVAEALHEGLCRLGKAVVGQMHNATLPPAGQLLACSIDAAGTARITCKISDEVAAQKVEHGVYPMIELVHAGSEILEVALVDRAQLEKRGGRLVLAEIFKRGKTEMEISDARKSAIAAIEQAQRTLAAQKAMVGRGGDITGAEISLRRAVEAGQQLLIKERLQGQRIVPAWAGR